MKTARSVFFDTRLVWNLGFWPDPELREVACVLAYEEAMARLFEGMVLLRVGYGNRVQAWSHGLGEPVKFMRSCTSTPTCHRTPLIYGGIPSCVSGWDPLISDLRHSLTGISSHHEISDGSAFL